MVFSRVGFLRSRGLPCHVLLVVGYDTHATIKSCYDFSGALPGKITKLTRLERGTS